MAKGKSTEDKKTFSISLPMPLYDILKEEAEQEIRSINTQIEYILRKHYDKKDS